MWQSSLCLCISPAPLARRWFVGRCRRSTQEIVAEGQKLHHCVGRYAEQMAEGDCAILFLRQEQEVETPYYTVEVQGNNIIQVRGAHNCAPTPEVKKFLNAWEEKHLKGAA